MSILLESTEVKGMRLRNRIVRSATMDHFSYTGDVTTEQIDLYTRLAKGGVGLIITGLAYVHPTGQVAPRQSSIADDTVIPGLRELTSAVHAYGAKIAMQLAHAGRARAHLLSEQIPEGRSTPEDAMGVSVIENDPYFPHKNYRSMTEAEILQITDAFGLAAKRARDSGFDAVQLHAAHGYLPSQFLSPFTNRRSDAWGGALENRLRFHFEIYKAIKKHAGPDFPVLLKLGVRDGFDGGLPFSDGQRAAVLLAEQGYDALEISQGLRGKWYSGTEFRTGIRSQEKEAYFRAWSRAVTSMVDVPVMLVGGLRTFRLMEEIVSSSDADYVSLCRPLIRECDLVNTWKTNPDYVPECISCNQCGEALKKGFTAHCVQAKRTV